MGAYEDWIKDLDSLPVDKQKEVERQLNEMCRTMEISSGASHLATRGYLREDYSPSSVARTSLFGSGEHYVYVWKHLNGMPFYVGSGKNARSTSISSNRPDSFYAELLAFDAVVCYIAVGISEEDARFIEHYCSFSLSSAGINLTNKDRNVFNMTDKAKKNFAARCNKDKAKTDVIDARLDFLLTQKDRPVEHYEEIVKTVWRKYGTIYQLQLNENLSRAVDAFNADDPERAVQITGGIT